MNMLDEDVRRLIARLPVVHRLLMVLTRIEGFTCEEIASLACLPPELVRSSIDHANRLIKKELLKSAISVARIHALRAN